MTDASLRRFARLVFPGVSSRARIVYVGYGISTVRLPFALMSGLPLLKMSEFDIDNPTYVDVRIVNSRPNHRGKRRREFYWGYTSELDVLVVARR